MFYIIRLLVWAVWGFIPLLPMMALFHFMAIKKDGKNALIKAMPHMVAVYIFSFAILVVLSVTDIPNLYGITVDARINMVPFTDIRTNFHQYVLNALLFIPVGFLMPMLWTKFDKKHLTFIYAFLFSLFIKKITFCQYPRTLRWFLCINKAV